MRQRLVVHDHCGGHVAGGLPGVGDHRDDRFPDEADHAVRREAAIDLGVPRRGLQLQVRIGELLDLLGQQGAEVARHRRGAGDVDAGDPGARVRGADEDQVAQACRGVSSPRLALRLEQAVVLLAAHRLAGEGGRRAGDLLGGHQ